MTFRSATVQFKPEWGNPAANRKQIAEIVAQCASQNVQLVVLPEMCVSGYVFSGRDEILPYCEENEGESFVFFSNLAKQMEMFLVYGFAERDGEALYNSQNLIAPTGERLATYRKTHLYKADETWATPGDTGFLAVDTGLGRLGLGICMDLNFDDFVRFHKRQKTDIICFSACWLDEGLEIRHYWLYRLYGYENGILIANSYGEEHGTHFRGESCIINRGEVIATAPLTGQGVLLAEHARGSQPA